MNEHTRSFRDLSAEGFDTRTLLEERRRAGDRAPLRGLLHRRRRLAPLRDRGVQGDRRVHRGPGAAPRGQVPGHVARRHLVGDRLLPGDRRPHHPLSRAQEREGAADAASRHHADGALDGPARRRHGGACSRRRCSTSSNCPRHEVEVGLARGYNRWLCDTILDKEPRIKSMLYLPFHDPEACYKIDRGVRRAQGRRRLHGDGDALHAQLHKPVHEDVRGAAGARTAARLPRRVHLGRPEPAAHQPLHRRARPRLHLVQHAAHGELAGERHAGALPQAQDDLDRVRPRLDPVPDAAARQRVHDAHVGRAAAQAQAERLHARDVFHLAADGDGGQPQGARGHLRDDQRADAAALFVRLSALGHGPAGDDLRPAVHRHAGQAATSSAATRRSCSTSSRCCRR